MGNRDAGGHDFCSRLLKIVTETGHVTMWRGPCCYPGEPVFVPTPYATAEDDGIILSVVLDSAKGLSFLLVLDAATLTERARAEIPHPIPFHFHGNYLRRMPAIHLGPCIVDGRDSRLNAGAVFSGAYECCQPQRTHPLVGGNRSCYVETLSKAICMCDVTGNCAA